MLLDILALPSSWLDSLRVPSSSSSLTGSVLVDDTVSESANLENMNMDGSTMHSGFKVLPLYPISIATLGFIIVAHLGCMSNTCTYWLALTLAFLAVLEGLSLTIPLWFAGLCVLTTALIHLPLFPKRVSLGLTLWAMVASSATLFSPEVEEDFRVLLFLIGALFAVRRIVLLLLTLAATVKPTLFFIPISKIVPPYSFSDHDFFRADSPPEEIALRRENAFDALQAKWNKKWPRSLETSGFLAQNFSDLRFTSSNRVFLPFKKKIENWCDPCTVVERSEGTDLIDVDEQRLIDVAGSYGVNVCGYEMYKKFLDEGWEKAKAVGPVLGPIHPLLPDCIRILKQISHKDEISFHMSGTEAVMSAARLARFNTKRKYAVVFGGAYHGWWDGVQPMAGNDRVPSDILTLTDMSPTTLMVLKARYREIACVLVNPLQAFHPNSPPPSDLVLASNTRGVSDSTLEYRRWLQKLRQTCTELGIVLIFDEVFTGFRLAQGGAQEYFQVEADMVCYGKTLGGGMPNGVVCGPRRLMSRCDPDAPLSVLYIVGTFAAHPLLLGAMHSFLNWVITQEARESYDRLRRDVATWTRETNEILHETWSGDPPVEVHSYSSVWTIIYRRPGRYHWILQYILRDEGVNLSWVGTGRLCFSLDFQMEDLIRVREKLIRACHRMEEAGWWWKGASQGGTMIKMKLAKEITGALVKKLFS